MKISAPYFLYNQEFWNIQLPRKNIGQTPPVRIQNQRKALLVFGLKSIIASKVQENFGTICHKEVCLTLFRLRVLFTEQEKLKGQA